MKSKREKVKMTALVLLVGFGIVAGSTCRAGQLIEQNPANKVEQHGQPKQPSIIDMVVKAFLPQLQYGSASVTAEGIVLENLQFKLGETGGSNGSGNKLNNENQYDSECYSSIPWAFKADRLIMTLEFGTFGFRPCIASVKAESITIESSWLKAPLEADLVELTRDTDNGVFNLSPVKARCAGQTIEIVGALPIPSAIDTDNRMSGLNIVAMIKGGNFNLQSLVYIPTGLASNYVGGAAGEVRLSGTGGGVSVEGKVNLSRGRILVPELKKTQLPVPPGCIESIDMTLSVGPSVRLVTDKLSVDLDGEITLSGTHLEGLKVSGVFDVNGGQLNIRGSMFEVLKGTVSIASLYDLTLFNAPKKVTPSVHNSTKTVDPQQLTSSIQPQNQAAPGLDEVRHNNYVTVNYRLRIIDSLNEQEEYIADVRGGQGQFFVGLTCSRLFSSGHLPHRLPLNVPIEGEIYRQEDASVWKKAVADHLKKSSLLRNLFAGSLLESTRRSLERLLGVDRVRFSFNLSQLKALRIPRFDITKNLSRNVSLSYCRDTEESVSRLGVCYRPDSRITIRGAAEMSEIYSTHISVGISVGFEF